MTKEELFETLREKFKELLKEYKCDTKNISIKSRGMTPKEAIGETKRADYPILTGKEIMVMAEYRGCIGQAFTSAPADYTGNIDNIINADIASNEHARALFIACINAVMRYLGLIDHTVHCKNNGPEECAKDFIDWLKENFDNPNILQIGYQPALFNQLSLNYNMRILDLDPENIGKTLNGVTVEDGGKEHDEVIAWADLILCTGSTIANGSIVEYLNYMESGKDVRFYGTTLAGAAYLLGLKRVCFKSE